MSYSNLLGSDFRQEDIDRHRGTNEDFVAQHTVKAIEAAVAGKNAIREFLPFVLQRIADVRNLGVAWDYLEHNGGDAPGPNGLTYSNFDCGAKWRRLRQLRRQITESSYTCGPVETKEVPEGGDRGYRTVTLFSIEDRVVQRGAMQMIQPLLDPRFHEHSFGGRPGRGTFHALARAQLLLERDGRTIWIIDDIRNAFDQVPLHRLLDVLRQRLPATDVVDFIARVLGNRIPKGLPQGAPLSQLLMNLYLDHFLDRVWERLHPATPLLRFVDDILVMCRPEDDVSKIYADLQCILRNAAMPLKGNADSAIHDLASGEGVRWLGFQVLAGDSGLEVHLPSLASNGDWLQSLRENLLRAHMKPNSPLAAIQVVNGTIGQVGPCFPFSDHERVIESLMATAFELGFAEMPTKDELVAVWCAAYERWCRICRRALAADKSFTNTTAAKASRFLDEFAPTTRSPRLSMRRNRYLLYTDGCCMPGTGVGGWAFILSEEHRTGKQLRQESGAFDGATSSRAELLALIMGLEGVPPGGRVRVVSDSTYIVDAINRNLLFWMANGWRTKTKGWLQNEDLWRRAIAALECHKVSASWIPAHSGHPQNELCDQQARKMAEQHVASR